MSTKKTIKDINDLLNTTGDKVYLCNWNDGQIIEIHTLKTLLYNYADIKDDYDNNTKLAYSGTTIRWILSNLSINESHLEDNMYIQRIK